MKAVTDTKYYNEIAKAIQDYTGYATMTPSKMAENVRGVWDEGYQEGYEGGILIGRADGIQAQYDEFWDSILPEGEILDLQYAFGGKRWSTSTFNPPRTIVGSSFFRCFASTTLTAINKTIDVTHATGSTALQNMFNGAAALEIINDFYASESTTFHNTAFNGCSNLKILNVRGTIGKNGLSLHDCTRLTAESLISVLKACNKKAAGVSITLPANKEAVINENAELLEELNRATSETYGYSVVYD